MKRLIVLTFGLLMCFSTVSSIQTEACSDLIVSMCPSNPAAYPTYGGWEPAHLGTLTSLSFNMQTLQKGIYLLWEQRKEILFAQLLYSRKIWG